MMRRLTPIGSSARRRQGWGRGTGARIARRRVLVDTSFCAPSTMWAGPRRGPTEPRRRRTLRERAERPRDVSTVAASPITMGPCSDTTASYSAARKTCRRGPLAREAGDPHPRFHRHTRRVSVLTRSTAPRDTCDIRHDAFRTSIASIATGRTAVGRGTAAGSSTAAASPSRGGDPPHHGGDHPIASGSVEAERVRRGGAGPREQQPPERGTRARQPRLDHVVRHAETFG